MMAHEFPGFRTVERLHASSRSIVDRATRLTDGARVVLKQPAGDLVAAEALARLQHEHDLLHELRGPGIITVLELVRDGSRAALVLEDFGTALAHWIAEHRLPLAEVLDVGIALAGALARIHAARVIHKDVNPHNIVYEPATRTTKLIDFDIATRARQGGAPAVAGSALEGTLAYLAPEQTGRLDCPLDARSDLYALGITLYELFTGSPPFHGDDALGLVHAHLAEQPRRVDDIDPAIPSVIGDIVTKLCAKAPEQRYQSAAGLRADLERCRRALDPEGRIAAFALAGQDRPTRIAFSDRLRGRADEVRALLDAFDRTSHGAVETVLVSGYAGIGKSSLVREIHPAVTARRGFSASGKFEQLNRDAPYSAVVCALDQLVTRILAEPAFERWATEIARAIGDDGPLVRSVLPGIERVIEPVIERVIEPVIERVIEPVRGAEPATPALDPGTARHRLAGALSRLVQVFARRAHPLVIVLDDMQWADTASLQLLTELAISEHTESLLVIAAYRDNEVDPAHPFAIALGEHARRGARISRIALEPLTLAQTTELIADALRQPAERAAGVAAVVWRKTEGNPFFIRQFMQALHDDGCIVFDASAGAFAPDLGALDRAAITENVADLLARQLGKLPDATREVLVAAAAIGAQFDVATLAVAAGRPPAELAAALAPAVDAGMIVALAEPARFDAGDPAGARYRFQHDRIQQAAYEAAPGDARERLHLAIARQLLASASPAERDLRLFEIVHHLMRGVALLDDEAERTRFVELGLEAARRARRAGAFDIAATILGAASALRDWRTHHATWFESTAGLAEALMLNGQHGEARAIVEAARSHATPRERATLETLDGAICTALGLMTESVTCGRRAASLVGIDLPSDPVALGRQVEAELGLVLAAFAARPIETWIDLPVMTDPDQLAVMTLLDGCIAAAYQCEPPLLVLIAAKLVLLSLRHGNCGASARGYSTLAIVLWGMADYAAAFRLGQLAVDLVEKLDARALVSVHFTFAAFVSPWRLPIEHTVALLRAAVGRASDVGDRTHAAYAATFEIRYRLTRGEPLDALIEDARRHRALCVRLGLSELATCIGWFIAHARMWTGTPPGPGETDLDFAATDRVLAGSARSLSLRTSHQLLEVERRYWAQDHAGALELVRSMAPLDRTMPGNASNAEYRMYACLAAIASEGADTDIAGFRADLANYAAACPANYRHMALLVDAELARARGDLGGAVTLYDAAIASAAEHGFVKLEVLANELAARLWSERDKPVFAAAHLAKARDVCVHWGARARARDLELARRRLGATIDHHATTGSSTSATTTLDFATVLKASQAIASDMVQASMLGKMMEIIVENTGAQAGAIVLDTGGVLAVHAAKRPGAAIAVSGGVPLADAGEVCERIVTYVTRTGQRVVIGEATRHATFGSDPYVRERRPRSVLCLPIAHQDRVLGAVYLENNLVADAFTVERLHALGILVGQLAVSIENAQIFARLEDLVAERTRALTCANQQLREQALVRERIESELRLAQKLQSVGQLASGVAHEINTPMQYIGDNVAFLDDAFGALLGVVDHYRAAIESGAPIDRDALHQAEDAADLDYLRANVPGAIACARDGVSRVSRIVHAMRTFAHPDQRDQAATALDAALENTLLVAHNEYRDVADVVTEFAAVPEIVCHPGELKQVFLNLVVNAAHAIADRVKAGAPRGTITIRTCRDGDDHVVVTVADTGGGIPEVIRDRVFDPFFTTKDVGRGTGQGLALARTAIVDRHGGTIWFETRTGEGTTFFVRIPIRGRLAASALPPQASQVTAR